MSAVLALFGALLLATCSPSRDGELHLAASVTPPAASPASGRARFADTLYIADDGARLPLRRWLPKGRVKAVVLALHGFNDYSHGFDMPAAHWAEAGIATYAYDQRGFGAAPGRGLWAGEGRLVVDAIVATRLLRQSYPGRPVYLLGESMGGALALLAATGASRGVLPGPDGSPVADIDGVVLSAPAVWGRNTMDLVPKLALFAGVRLFPSLALTGRGLRILASDNLPMLRALGRDPWMLKGARLDTIYGLVDLMDDALAAAPRLAMPSLILYGAKDQLVPRPALAALVARLPAGLDGRRRLAYYRDGYHLLLRDREAATVARDVVSWIFDRRKLLPSHADAASAARPWPPAEGG